MCLSLLHTRAHPVGMNHIDGELFVMACTPACDPTVFDLSLGCEVLHLSLIMSHPNIVTLLGSNRTESACAHAMARGMSLRNCLTIARTCIIFQVLTSCIHHQLTIIAWVCMHVRL